VTHRCGVLIALALLASAAHPARAQSPEATAHPTAALGWLAGCWERRAGTRLVEERWLPPRGGILLGVGRTTRGDTLVEWEQLRIYAAGDTLVYAAQPSGQPAAEFRAAPDAGADSLAARVVFANAAHDFPQRVVYRRAGADSLLARVEGTVAGRARARDFAYARARC
jgi:hypothetical protein